MGDGSSGAGLAGSFSPFTEWTGFINNVDTGGSGSIVMATCLDYQVNNCMQGA